MKIMTVGKIIEVEVIGFNMDNYNLIVVSDGVQYEMEKLDEPLMARQSEPPAKPVEATRPPSVPVRVVEALPAPGERPSVERAIPATNRIPHPDKPIQQIASWLVNHPEDLGKYYDSLTLNKRRLVSNLISQSMPDGWSGNTAIQKFISVTPAPEFSTKGVQWGGGSSLAADMLHEGQSERILAREDKHRGTVPKEWAGVRQARALGENLTVSEAVKAVEDWSKKALGK